MQFIDLEAQYKHLKEKIDTRIHNVLSHGKYIMGPEVFELETKLAEYIGVKHVITCANGTDALTLAMMALGIQEGDAVFCPTFTFFASAETIAFAHATPIFVDSDEATFNICPKDLEKRIQNVIVEGKLIPKAIVAVDLFGLPANYSKIEAIAQKYGIKIIEDAAQGFGGSIDGKMAGSFGDIATTSFFPAKPLGCYGDGGAVFTNNDHYADLLRSLRIHGKGVDKYDNVRIGINSRLDTIQSAILIEKLNAFPDEIKNRNQLADTYRSRLSEELVTPKTPEGYVSSWAQFTLRSPKRNFHMSEYRKKDIPTMIYYNTCMHDQTAFEYLSDNSCDFPIANILSKEVFSLPMHPYMKNDELELILSIIR
ncbi:DegT/DnrJ/EryC1/StrS family aminotransferase [Vibrio sp. VB16]|uniref:DegT/DnrJ/EryC1/StrS family aminotransferase n=1 Tax=Vibrio sp. VB16 TaxID=2785746 RepID=UPI0018A12020|nr:DegT/DnrJ/EryC1/StrS family aminotransferase [Vibrio sp. VB16]UGA54983.1 DegT/DnrJ/EryC1/StrS family aminotransferase [Vibrio sp. VB16]